MNQTHIKAYSLIVMTILTLGGKLCAINILQNDAISYQVCQIQTLSESWCCKSHTASKEYNLKPLFCAKQWYAHVNTVHFLFGYSVMLQCHTFFVLKIKYQPQTSFVMFGNSLYHLLIEIYILG